MGSAVRDTKRVKRILQDLADYVMRRLCELITHARQLRQNCRRMWVSQHFHQHMELHKTQNTVCNCSLKRNTTLQEVKIRLFRGEETQGLVDLENTQAASYP